MAHSYHPGRDDTSLDRLQRQLTAEWALVTFGPELETASALNARYDGTWHIWFSAQGTDSVEWSAKTIRGGQVLLTAATPEELVAKIEEET